MSSSNYCFLTCIQVSQEAGQVVMAILRIYSSILFCTLGKKKHVAVQSLSSVQFFAMPWHTRVSCPSLSLRVCSNSCPLSRWCPPISYLLPPPSPPASSLSQHQGFFSNESALSIRWPKFWSFSFSISPSNVYSVLIFFRIDRCWILSSAYLTSMKNRNARKIFF